jgi:pantoate--beta-alanine ligase
MESIHTVAWMKQCAAEARRGDRLLGLVPTMGALHEGHLSLVREAQRRCWPVVVSIFVNPKQFGPSEDFQRYPRTIEADREALNKRGVDYVFVPSPEEIYPAGFRTSVTVEGLSDLLEGRSRPGHFRGVTTVVLKLFDIVQPRLAFLGRKDAQQARIVRQMARDLDLDTEIVVCPIVREPDGLAMSSRNKYLSVGDRRAATVLWRSLERAKSEIAGGETDVVRIAAAVRGVLEAEPGVTVDYAEIVDADTLEPAITLRKPCYIVIAARVGNTRLIDNALVEPAGDSLIVTI